MRTTAFLLLTSSLAVAARAEEPASSAPRKLVFDVDFAMANVNDDSLLRTLGRERVTKIPYALLSASGELNPHLSYRIEVNAVDDSRVPEPFTPTSATPFFFPNLADTAYGVSSNPIGQFKVDDYKNTGWDPYLDEQHLRRAFVDAHTADRRCGIVAGRFFPGVGFSLEDVRWYTAKDLTHIQMIDALVETGAELYARLGPEDGRHARISAAVVGGNGNPYHDYDYFDFTGGQNEDTNSQPGAVATIAVWPTAGLRLQAGAEFNYVGSRIEVDTTLERSKHYDNKYVLSARYRPPQLKYLTVFGEAARYKWGLRDTAAELLPGPPTKTPIDKDGYYVGAELEIPLRCKRCTVGASISREELSRDDSLVAYLAARNLLDVSLGKKERGTIVKLFADIGPISVFVFNNDLQNPFPQVSAIVTTSGPFAFQGVGDAKFGAGFRFKTTF